MGAASRMVYRARLERDTQLDPNATPDDWGDPGAPAWVQTYDSVACWIWTNMARELGDQGGIRVIEDVRMLVPRDTDVTTKDKVLDVTDRAGATIRTGPYLITAVVNRRDHLELALRAVA